MKIITLISLVAFLVSGCVSTRTWKDIAESDARLAAKVEYWFLNSTWKAYLAAHVSEPMEEFEYRRKAVKQHCMLQTGGFAASIAYQIHKTESESNPSHASIFLDVTRVADLMEQDFLETFGKNTHLNNYPRVPNKTNGE